MSNLTPEQELKLHALGAAQQHHRMRETQASEVVETAASFQRYLEGEPPQPRSDDDVERLCEVMHDAYEKAAVGAGWETQQASRKPWADVPEANKVTMRASVRALLAELGV